MFGGIGDGLLPGNNLERVGAGLTETAVAGSRDDKGRIRRAQIVALVVDQVGEVVFVVRGKG